MAMVIKSGNNRDHPYGGASRKHVKNMLARYPKSRNSLNQNKLKWINRMTALSSILIAFEKWFQYPKAKKYKIQNGPIFVIGHPRSGTTHLHNLLCQDSQFGYLNNAQAFCPAYFLSQKIIAKYIFKKLLPDERPVDKVEQHPNSPQEDDFAIANMTHLSPYHGMYFPSQHPTFTRYLRISELTQPEIQEWLAIYKRILTKLTYYWRGKTLVLKNPPNTARIAILKKHFPKAKFIYILRHPEHVFPSMEKFMHGLLEIFMLESELINPDPNRPRDAYIRTMKDVISEARKLPKSDFIGIKYEDLLDEPMGVLQKIYSTLALGHFDEQNYLGYLDNQKKHKVQKHIIDQELKNYLGQEVYDLYEEHERFVSQF